MTHRKFALLRPVLHLIGVECDSELARRSGASRSQICWIRLSLQIPARPRVVIMDDQRRDCLRRVKAKETLKSVSAVTGLTIQTVKNLALSVGWNSSWSRPLQQPSTTIGRITRTKMASLLRAGKTTYEVAELAGVSHQRITQVAKVIGMPRLRELRSSIWDKQRRQREREKDLRRKRREKERAKRPALLLAKLRRFLGPARKMYAKGRSVSGIAKRYQMSARSMSWWLFRGRRDLGWFPKRRLS